MKKLFALLLSALLLLSACGETVKDPTPDVEKKGTEKVEEKTEEPKEDKEEDKLIVKVEELPYTFKIDEKPDSAGAVYVNFEFENKSKYPVVSFNLTINNKDVNEKSYAGIFDTVMPGEKSAKFETFGPKTSKKEDMEVLKLEYKVKDTENKKEYMFEYDYKLKEYEVYDVSE